MYHPGDDKSINFAYFDKDRTGVHNGGEVVEDLTLRVSGIPRPFRKES
ncbi:MAG: hypothetical protein ACLRWM_01450 [Streptococcus sp.]